MLYFEVYARADQAQIKKALDDIEDRNRKNLVKILIDAAKRSPISEDVPSSGSFEAVFSKTNNDGITALRLALRENEPDVVELIILENPAYQAGNASDISELKSLSREIR
ncbi:hypothetical protein POM88_011385 [Heracleum sosnowskyi]|uniref:Uncharacterized protein n=1 Tax=Heracleum sosnowskyi TaxID=360622 RepID=A0AAD8N0R3_9APIA|nr:hypothetical protein POM88_011385 [Heracleum sosnowskyi]